MSEKKFWGIIALNDKSSMDAYERALYADGPEAGPNLNAKKLSTMAQNRRHFIYDPELRQWYTPQEFYEKFKIYESNFPLFTKVIIADPLKGLTTGYKQIQEILQKMAELSEKISKANQPFK